MQTTPYIYIERKLYLRKPYNLSPRLLGLAYKAPARRLRVTYGAPTTLLFNLLRNYYCRNKPTDALVSQTLLYYYRVIRGHPLLAPLPSIAISFATQNQFSIFQLISHQVTALRPFYNKSSILQFSVLATKSIASQLVYKGYSSITCFSIYLSQLYLHLRLPTRTPTQQSQSFSPITPMLKSVAIIFSAFIRPSRSPSIFTPYSINYATAQVFLALVNLYTFNSYTPLQCQSSQYYIAVDGFPAFFYALLWLFSPS